MLCIVFVHSNVKCVIALFENICLQDGILAKEMLDLFNLSAWKLDSCPLDYTNTSTHKLEYVTWIHFIGIRKVKTTEWLLFPDITTFTICSVCTICLGKSTVKNQDVQQTVHTYANSHADSLFLSITFIGLLLHGHLANFHNGIEIWEAGKQVGWWSAWQRENGSRAHTHHRAPLQSIHFHCSGLQRIIINYRGS